MNLRMTRTRSVEYNALSMKTCYHGSGTVLPVNASLLVAYVAPRSVPPSKLILSHLLPAQQAPHQVLSSLALQIVQSFRNFGVPLLLVRCQICSSMLAGKTSFATLLPRACSLSSARPGSAGTRKSNTTSAVRKVASNAQCWFRFLRCRWLV